MRLGVRPGLLDQRRRLAGGLVPDVRRLDLGHPKHLLDPVAESLLLLGRVALLPHLLELGQRREHAPAAGHPGRPLDRLHGLAQYGLVERGLLRGQADMTAVSCRVVCAFTQGLVAA